MLAATISPKVVAESFFTGIRISKQTGIALPCKWKGGVYSHCRSASIAFERRIRRSRSKAGLRHPLDADGQCAEPCGSLYQLTCCEYAHFMDKHRKGSVALGIRDEFVAVSDHIGYFWESEDEFAEAVAFLEYGLHGNDSCIIF